MYLYFTIQMDIQNNNDTIPSREKLSYVKHKQIPNQTTQLKPESQMEICTQKVKKFKLWQQESSLFKPTYKFCSKIAKGNDRNIESTSNKMEKNKIK